MWGENSYSILDDLKVRVFTIGGNKLFAIIINNNDDGSNNNNSNNDSNNNNFVLGEKALLLRNYNALYTLYDLIIIIIIHTYILIHAILCRLLHYNNTWGFCSCRRRPEPPAIPTLVSGAFLGAPPESSTTEGTKTITIIIITTTKYDITQRINQLIQTNYDVHIGCFTADP